MTVLTVDLETQTHIYNKRKASPFDPRNYVVAAGYKRNDQDTWSCYFADSYGFTHHLLPLEEVEVLAGFNIKFDLLYMWHKPELQHYFLSGGRIWDCQYAYYLLEGARQKAHMASMDSIIEMYGGDLKYDEVKALWEAGVQTSDIDPTLLCDYLARDVDNTYLMYDKQVQQCKDMHPKFLTMVQHRMDGLLATTEMEYNGMQVDTEQGESDRFFLQKELEALQDDLNAQLPELPPELQFNWQSVYHRSYLLYGGACKYKKWMPHLDEYGEPTYCKKTAKLPLCKQIGAENSTAIPMTEPPEGWEQITYAMGKKAGQLKFKNVQEDDYDRPKGAQTEQVHLFKRLTVPHDHWASSLTDAHGDPIFSTSSDIIDYLGSHSDVAFLAQLARSQSLSKDIGTYYWAEDKHGTKKGMLTLVGDDGRIHHKLNHTSTVTTRMTSNDPNMQNIPKEGKSTAKKMFISRFGEDGRIVEIDYSQLEVVVQAILSNDKQLCQDLRDGIDFHVKRLAASTGRDYAELKALHLAKDKEVCAGRTQAKGFSFQRAYGAGAKAIAASTGMSEEEVLKLIAVEEELYPGVLKFDQEVEASIKRTSKVAKGEFLFFDHSQYPVKTGEWFAPTGTRYVWQTHEALDWMKQKGTMTTFSPTERKNWPPQGTGGEIMQTMLGKVWRWFNQQRNFGGKAFLINTVHDCVLIDVHKDTVDSVVPTICKILEAVPFYFNKAFGLNINVPFPVSAEIGHNWYEMEEYHHD